jgi:hypothetical protein
MDNASNPVEVARLVAGVSLQGLSNTTGIPRNTLRRKLEHPNDFTVGEWFRVCAALRIDPAETATALAKAA